MQIDKVKFHSTQQEFEEVARATLRPAYADMNSRAFRREVRLLRAGLEADGFACVVVASPIGRVLHFHMQPNADAKRVKAVIERVGVIDKQTPKASLWTRLTCRKTPAKPTLMQTLIHAATAQEQ